MCALIAQLDRALPSGGTGRGFESLQVLYKYEYKENNVLCSLKFRKFSVRQFCKVRR